jgi:hypothetical protein
MALYDSIRRTVHCEICFGRMPCFKRSATACSPECYAAWRRAVGRGGLFWHHIIDDSETALRYPAGSIWKTATLADYLTDGVTVNYARQFLAQERVAEANE